VLDKYPDGGRMRLVGGKRKLTQLESENDELQRHSQGD
jgi:hypothetical protein